MAFKAFSAVNGEVVVKKVPVEACSVCQEVTDCMPFGKDETPICLNCALQNSEIMDKAIKSISEELCEAWAESQEQKPRDA